MSTGFIPPARTSTTSASAGRIAELADLGHAAVGAQDGTRFGADTTIRRRPGDDAAIATTSRGLGARA
jgi:hypothetical protein